MGFRVDFEIQVAIVTDTSVPNPNTVETVQTIITLKEVKQVVDRAETIVAGTANVYGKGRSKTY